MMARRTLPQWDDRWSDGCSVPRIARGFLPEEQGETRQCCVRHDEAYYYGGSREERQEADGRFSACLLAAGVPPWLARVYYLAVRVGGHPRFRRPNVSWAFGGDRFRYDPEPAIPEDPAGSGP